MKRKVQLYIISLWFLWLLIFISKVKLFSQGPCGMWYLLSGWALLKANVVSLIAVIMMVLAYVFYRELKYDVVDPAGGLAMKVDSVESIEYEALSFLVTFIIPLACIDVDFNVNGDFGRSLIFLFVTLFVIGMIYVRTNMFHTNPTLALWGFKVYKVTIVKEKPEDKERQFTIISQKPIVEGMYIRPTRIDDTFYYVTGQ